jgi:hypothetical protein
MQLLRTAGSATSGARSFVSYLDALRGYRKRPQASQWMPLMVASLVVGSDPIAKSERFVR